VVLGLKSFEQNPYLNVIKTSLRALAEGITKVRLSLYNVKPESAFNENLFLLKNCEYEVYSPLKNIQHACNAEGVGHSNVGNSNST
jgi:hypothetical protein